MSDEGETSITIGGFPISGWMVAVALPVLSAVGGGVWYVFDLQSRFLGVEEAVTTVLDVEGRVAAIEQTVADNSVSSLASRLTELGTTMQTILEQQRTLLDLRSKVERSETITGRLDGSLAKYDTEINDLWKAVDELSKNPLGR